MVTRAIELLAIGDTAYLEWIEIIVNIENIYLFLNYSENVLITIY